MANFFDDDDDEDVQNKLRSPSAALNGDGVAQQQESFFSPTRRMIPGAVSPPMPARSPSAFAQRARGDSVFNFDIDNTPPRQRQRGQRRQTSPGFAGSPRGDDLEDVLGEAYGDGVVESNMRRMIRAWTNECGAPELLRFPNALVTRFAGDIAIKREFVRQMNTPLDPAGKPWKLGEAHWIQVAIVQTEIMRASYVLKQLLRERLSKVERFARYYLSIDDGRARMHPNEIEHAEGFVALQDEYYRQSVMDSMPERVQNLNEPNMVAAPDLSKAVFVRARRDCGPVVLPNAIQMYLAAGSTHMLRYSTIRALLEDNQVELV